MGWVERSLERGRLVRHADRSSALLDGGDAGTPGIIFLTEGTDGLFVVSDDLLDDPRSFSWAMTASLLMLPLPSDDLIDLDANYEEMIAFDR